MISPANPLCKIFMMVLPCYMLINLELNSAKLSMFHNVIHRCRMKNWYFMITFFLMWEYLSLVIQNNFRWISVKFFSSIIFLIRLIIWSITHSRSLLMFSFDNRVNIKRLIEPQEICEYFSSFFQIYLIDIFICESGMVTISICNTCCIMNILFII